jgi:hypothetical protein
VRQHYLRLGMIAIADSLDLLRGWRNQCDYRNSVNRLGVILPLALAEADSVVNQL